MLNSFIVSTFNTIVYKADPIKIQSPDSTEYFNEVKDICEQVTPDDTIADIQTKIWKTFSLSFDYVTDGNGSPFTFVNNTLAGPIENYRELAESLHALVREYNEL